ncbi:MAG: glycoside hydrolase family 2 protein [Myxococcota bacterium]
MKTRTLHDNWLFSAKSWLAAPGGWYGYSKLEWLRASVPGHVHLDLLANVVIADPYENLQELGSRWVDEEDWVYKTEFEFTPDAGLPRVKLCCAGLDTVATLYLNGKQIGAHDNMFVDCAFDVGGALVAGKNELEIHFEAALRVGSQRRHQYFEREGLPLDTVHFDERAFVRKAQYMFGWDWGPRLVSAGIWGKLELVQYQARFEHVHVSQRHLPDGSVELRFASEFEGQGQAVHFIEGVPGSFRDGESVRIEKPELWWPRGFGKQHLYRVTSLLVPNATAPRAELESAALDRRETRVGLRRVAIVQKADSFGESFEFEWNGLRVYCVGANWIPDSCFPASVTREQVRAQIERAVGLNMNMLRIWGGGVYESEDFYDACDELGVLVWQDFPYACSFYPDGPEAQEVARQEASAAVKRLRNRASLAIWCGNNENLTMFQDKWTDASKHPPRYYGGNLYDGVLPEVVKQLDPEHPYIPSSPFGGERANGGGVGDQHYWDVWHGRGDWKYYEDSTARFCSEFGFAAAPGRRALGRMASGEKSPLDLEVRDARARWHDKTRKGYETFIQYVELHYPVSRTLEDWLYYSQLNQRDALRHGIEHFRRSEFCKGSLIWQLNDCWPVQSWAVIDSEFTLKAAAFELERLYAPALISLEKLDGRVRVWAVLDNAAAPLKTELKLEARSLLDGRALVEQRVPLELKVGERRVVAELDSSRFEAASTVVVAELEGRTTFRLLEEPKNSRFGNAKLSVAVEGTELVVHSDLPVVDLYVWDEAGELALSHNFITLNAGATRRIALRGTPKKLAARSLAGRHAL